jgi:hypothetical protein
MKVGDEMIKKLWIICLLLTFSAFVSISCQNVSSDDAATEINSNDQRGRTKNAFKIVSSVSWIAESVAEDKIFEASLEKLEETPVSSEKASRARLIVRNVTDNRIIYEEPGDDFPESVSKIDYPVNCWSNGEPLRAAILKSIPYRVKMLRKCSTRALRDCLRFITMRQRMRSTF